MAKSSFALTYDAEKLENRTASEIAEKARENTGTDKRDLKTSDFEEALAENSETKRIVNFL